MKKLFLSILFAALIASPAFGSSPGLSDFDEDDVLTNVHINAIINAIDDNYARILAGGGGGEVADYFTATLLEHEHGGLEADVSAYDGIPGISAGSTFEAIQWESNCADNITGICIDSDDWKVYRWDGASMVEMGGSSVIDTDEDGNVDDEDPTFNSVDVVTKYNSLVIGACSDGNTCTATEIMQNQTIDFGTCTADLGDCSLTLPDLSVVETQYIPIGYAIDGATAPAAKETITSGTDKIDVRKFDGAAQDEDVLIAWQTPADLAAATGIKFRVLTVVTEATAPSTEAWRFELSGFSLTSGDALDGTLAGEQASASGDRSDAQYDLVYTAWSSAMTGITSLAAGELVHFKLMRDIDDSDTYAQDVGVAGIEFKYTRDLGSTSF
jgi:hypothetical protein